MHIVVSVINIEGFAGLIATPQIRYFKVQQQQQVCSILLYTTLLIRIQFCRFSPLLFWGRVGYLAQKKVEAYSYLIYLPLYNWEDLSQVGRSGVDRASSSDAQGTGFELRPLRFKKYHFFTPKLKGSPRSRAHPRISELSVRGRGQAEKKTH